MGSLVVVSGESLDDVRAWAATDPYVAAGLFAETVVTLAPETALHDAASLFTWS